MGNSYLTKGRYYIGASGDANDFLNFRRKK